MSAEHVGEGHGLREASGEMMHLVGVERGGDVALRRLARLLELDVL